MKVMKIEGIGRSEFAAVKNLMRKVKFQEKCLGEVKATGFISNCEVRNNKNHVIVSQNVGFLI